MNNKVGMLIFLALGIAVFVLMALRPAVERSTMNFGIPLDAEMAASTVESTEVEKVEEKQEEVMAPETEKTSDENSATDAPESETSSDEAPADTTESSESSTTTN